MTLDRLFVECSVLGFQSVLTTALAITCYVLWRRQRRDYFLTWSAAWFLYVLRLSAMSAFLVRRDMIWLFVHQVMTGLSALLLLAAAWQFSRGFTWRPWHLIAVPLMIGGGWLTIFGMPRMVVAGVTSTILLTSVTLWTGVVFWRDRARNAGGATTVLTWAFVLWGIHHLDYLLLRGFGAAVLYGVFVDVLFLFAIALGLLFLVLDEERARLATRTGDLEQLTRLLLRAQEDERRRIARELHDEAGQALTAVKIELDLDGHTSAGARVGQALAQVRDLSNLLRPSTLDDLGLAAALRALAADVFERSHLPVTLAIRGTHAIPADLEVVIYRVMQEALTNAVRHARASAVRADLEIGPQSVTLTVEDNGQGLSAGARPNLGWLGMQERVTAAGGTLTVAGYHAPGVRVEARIPVAVTS